MLFLYIKALHVIFIVTWFSGLFYIVRLFVYNAEAEDKPEEEKRILHTQFNKMMKGLWYGITWPSAILTLIFGSWTWYLFGITPSWLVVKLCFVFGLYLYHFSLHYIFKQQLKGVFKITSQQLRIWNEVATIFLVVIVMLVIVQNSLSVLWGIIGFVLFAIALMSAIKIYKVIRIKEFRFEDYKIHIELSEHFPNKFYAYIEELFGVGDTIDSEHQAAEKLRPLFIKEIKRLKDMGENIPKPGSGKALITLADYDKIEVLSPFIDEFWEHILGTSYATSFVSNESLFRDWEHYLQGGKQELIEKVKKYYHCDISDIYDKPIHEILTTIKTQKH